MQNHGRSEYNTNGRQQPSHHDLYPQPSSGRSADSDRSDIRVFEPQLPSQSDGNQLCGSHAQEEAESVRLISIAKEHKLYIASEEWNTLGVLHSIPSGESKIYYNEAQGLVYKVRNPFAKREIKQIAPHDVIYEHLIHNLLFPEARYSFIGVTEDYGEVRFVLSQAYFETLMPASDKRIEAYFRERGLAKEDAYFYGNAYFSITDVSQNSDNVFVDSDGKLIFIDPIIRLKKPAKEVLLYLENHPFLPINDNKPKRLTFRERLLRLIGKK